MKTPDLFLPPSPQPHPLRGSALFSPDRLMRREIRRWWVPEPRRWAAWLMTNPSDAGADRNDPTALRVTAFSRAWGFDGWIGVNLIPFVSSTMPEMWKWFDLRSKGHLRTLDALDDNLVDIRRVGRESVLRIVAFGADAPVRCPGWVDRCLDAFAYPVDYDASETLYCIGTTLDGHPKHPLARGKHRVPESAQPVLWRS